MRTARILTVGWVTRVWLATLCWLGSSSGFVIWFRPGGSENFSFPVHQKFSALLMVLVCCPGSSFGVSTSAVVVFIITACFFGLNPVLLLVAHEFADQAGAVVDVVHPVEVALVGCPAPGAPIADAAGVVE